MTDKIREPYYSLMYRASIGWNDHLFQVPPELLENFAQLVVKECSKTLRESKYQIAETDYYDGFNEGLEYSANRIEELFGVE